jgi:hypothetical protein
LQLVELVDVLLYMDVESLMQVNPLDVHIMFVARRVENKSKGFHKTNNSGDWILICCTFCNQFFGNLVSLNLANGTFLSSRIKL